MKWDIYGQDTVLCKLGKSELPGMFRKSVQVNPGEAAVVVRNGRVAEVIDEGRQQVSGMLDGVRKWFGGGEDLQVYRIRTTPFSLQLYAGSRGATSVGMDSQSQQTHGGVESETQWHAADLSFSLLSRDHVEMVAACSLTVCVDSQRLPDLVRATGGVASLATWDIAAAVKSGLVERVLVSEVAQRDAAEFRGNPELAAELESAARGRIHAGISGLGLTLQGFSISWGNTPQEEAEVYKQQAATEDALIEFNHIRRIRDLERETELERLSLENLHELKKLEQQGEAELAQLYLASELDQVKMTQGLRVDVAEIDARIRIIELDVQAKEDQLQLERQRQEQLLVLDREEREFDLRRQEADADSKRDMDEMSHLLNLKQQKDDGKHRRRMAERRQEIEAEFTRQTAEIDRQNRERSQRLQEDLARMGMMERLVAQGLNTGAADASVLNTMLNQSTLQGLATTSDAKVQAAYGAEGEKANLQTYMDAEDRERQQQKDMTGLSSDMMRAAKQNPGATTVVGAGAVPPASSVQMNVSSPTPPESGDDLRAKLKHLKELHAEGLIDDDDFKAQKAELLKDL